MERKNHEISVIVPVYNSEKYLRPCLDSIVNQTFRDIEIICVNDGSVDSSLQILEEYASKDDRFVIINQENGGAGKARNTGLRAASGKYLSFLDADDFFEPTMLEKAHEKIEKDNSDFVVFNSDQYITEKNDYVNVICCIRPTAIPPYSPFSYRQLTENIFKTFVGWAWDKLYRKSFVDEHNLLFQEQRTSNDLLFVFSALVVAKKISVIYDVLAHQRRDAEGSLSKTREKSWFCFYDALIALKDRIEKEGLYWELERDFINYALHFSLWNYETLAEQTKPKLKEKLAGEWAETLGIKGKTEEYFYNKTEYQEFIDLIKE